MHSLSDIQTAIAQLPLQDAHTLANWLREYLAIATDMAPEVEPESLTLAEKLQQARAEIKARRDAHHYHE